MADRKPIESWLTDMDGVLIHEGVPIPGADAFIKRLRDSGKPFLVLHQSDPAHVPLPSSHLLTFAA